MKVLEHYICGKENNELTCEDGLVITEHLIAVIDGVTAKGIRLWDGKSSGCFAKDLIVQYLQENEVVQCDAVELFSNLDKVIADAMDSVGDTILVEDTPRASVIVYNDIYQEVWSYGDCQCRINDEVYNHKKKLDRINEDIRAEKIEEYLSQGGSIEEVRQNDVGRAAIQENLLKQFFYENKKVEKGYPVLNGKGIEPEFITRYKVNSGDKVVLASDGYPKVYDNLKDSEAYLEYVLKEDPLCFRIHRSTKGVKEGNVSFDDRVFCGIVV